MTLDQRFERGSGLVDLAVLVVGMDSKLNKNSLKNIFNTVSQYDCFIFKTACV